MGSIKFFYVALLTLTLLLLLSKVPCEAKLSTKFYDRSCRNVDNIIRASIQKAVIHERRMAASLVRLHFHDCFVQGCDASVLLDETPTIQSEKSAIPNINSIRGFEVIESAKRDVERVCPGIVSCADILALAARDASVAVGGPSWTVRLGRRDSTTANRDEANSAFPPPSASLNDLITSFDRKGVSVRDMVALSGAHTLGGARCEMFRDRIYNGTGIDPNFARTQQRRCPQAGGDSNLVSLDLVTPNSFDNNYYRNLQRRMGLLQSDQVLLSGGSTDAIVNGYIKSPRLFANDFASAMNRISEMQPLLAPNGIVRRVCSAIN